MRTTTSVETLGMSRVRQSYEAQLEREADELADFEAIERELAAEKDAYLSEKHQYELLHDNFDDDLQPSVRPWHYASTHERSRHGADRQVHEESERGDLDRDAHSSLLFHDDHLLLLDDEEDARSAHLAPERRESDAFAPARELQYAASELSAISLNDSESWSDHHAVPPPQRQSSCATRPSQRHPRSPAASASRLLSAPPHDSVHSYGSFRSSGDAHAPHQSLARPHDAFSDDEDDDDDYDMYASGSSHGSRKSSSCRRQLGGEPPVSQLMRQFFGDSREPMTSARDNDAHDDRSELDDVDAFHDADRRRSLSRSINAQVAANGPATARSQLQPKLQPPSSSGPKRAAPGATRPVKTKPGAPASRSATSKTPPPSAPGTERSKTRSINSANGPILPVVIEEKLFELEEEVKFYKAETLQLQRKRESYDVAMKKLADERAAFAQFQTEQRALIEREWASERLKMKREEKLLERQVKLKLSAAASQHDRKDRSEIDALKAQIVTMQLDEKARANKWKTMNETLRQRIAVRCVTERAMIAMCTDTGGCSCIRLFF